MDTNYFKEVTFQRLVKRSRKLRLDWPLKEHRLLIYSNLKIIKTKENGSSTRHIPMCAYQLEGPNGNSIVGLEQHLAITSPHTQTRWKEDKSLFYWKDSYNLLQSYALGLVVLYLIVCRLIFFFPNSWLGPTIIIQLWVFTTGYAGENTTNMFIALYRVMDTHFIHDFVQCLVIVKH